MKQSPYISVGSVPMPSREAASPEQLLLLGAARLAMENHK